MQPTRQGGFRNAVRDLAGALLPLSARGLEQEIAERLQKIPTRLNEFGFDQFGMEPAAVKGQLLFSALLYRYYFRVETRGIEKVPSGRVLLVANHAGQLPFDGMMLGVAMLLEGEPPRIVRGMGEYWIPQLPFVSVAAIRSGSMVGTPENCVQMLEAEECVMVFPEGVRGMNKVYRERYKLQRFGQGFLRLALETETPIVPVGIVGSEEQQPGLTNLPRLGQLLGMPAFPLTLGFPWLGPLGILPMPVKYRIYFGDPLRFEGSPNEEDAAVQEKVDVVRDAIRGLLERGREERKGIFRG
jgi:1-acyl-sn-glycerol-3-phosphate acyltransferase